MGGHGIRLHANTTTHVGLAHRVGPPFTADDNVCSDTEDARGAQMTGQVVTGGQMTEQVRSWGWDSRHFTRKGPCMKGFGAKCGVGG